MGSYTTLKKKYLWHSEVFNEEFTTFILKYEFIMDKERYFMHFKGGLYKLIGYAYHSETQEEMVIYQALYGMHKIWVRPKTLFFDKVIRDGIEMNRFTEIAEKEMLCLLALKKENI